MGKRSPDQIQHRYEDYDSFQSYGRMDSELVSEDGMIIKNRFSKFQFDERFVRPIATDQPVV